MDANLTFTVNGQQKRVSTDPGRPLLDVLREDLQLTGTKYGCGEGKCGACTVLIDGKRAFSCRTEVESVAGKAVTTIEGIGSGDALHPVQEAFLECSAFQCGYCTPGMIVSTVALLKEKPKPTDSEARQWMNTNVCRCCSYANLLKAVNRAAELAGRQS